MKKEDILTEIIANKRFEVDYQRQAVTLELLENSLTDKEVRRSMKQALSEANPGIIAEFKRRSPSKGWINKEAEVNRIIPAYEQAGAAAISILTDEKYFGGTLTDIRKARPLTNLPILRKDFIIDEYQLYQAKIAGADAVLLIASALSKNRYTELNEQAHQLGLEVLLEIHNEDELEYITPQTDMVGVNNRNLGSFYTNTANSFNLAAQLPRRGTVLVSESGLSHSGIIRKLQQAGFHGFLIGETFMKTDNPGNTLQHFIADIRKQS